MSTVTSNLAGRYAHADVVRLDAPCVAHPCKRVALYAVALRNRQGAPGRALPLCGTHAKEMLKAHFQRASDEKWDQPDPLTLRVDRIVRGRERALDAMTKDD